jgi:hypothetical protein
MIHHSAQFDPQLYHYAVGHNDNFILVQVQERGEQARVPLTLNEAQHLVALLNLHINQMKMLTQPT